jgi:hypothetical protein
MYPLTIEQWTNTTRTQYSISIDGQKLEMVVLEKLHDVITAALAGHDGNFGKTH